MKEALEQVKSTLQRIIDADAASTEGPWESVGGGRGISSPIKCVAIDANPQDASFIVLTKTYSAPMAKALLAIIDRCEMQLGGGNGWTANNILQSIISTFPKE